MTSGMLMNLVPFMQQPIEESFNSYPYSQRFLCQYSLETQMVDNIDYRAISWHCVGMNQIVIQDLHSAFMQQKIIIRGTYFTRRIIFCFKG